MPTSLPNRLTAATAASMSSSRRATRCSVQRDARPSIRGAIASMASLTTSVTRDTGFFT
jgi:hypothetical protein